MPITEDMPLQPTNVYGRTKLMIEKMMADYSHAYGLRYVALRYFNAAGASLWETSGGSPAGDPSDPLILQAALGQRGKRFHFWYGLSDSDGTCLRDYIHVKDLASAHVLAMDHLRKEAAAGPITWGRKTAFSVREIIEAVKKSPDGTLP